jgi:ribosomal protein S18 acetylase RimI-like enzyme
VTTDLFDVIEATWPAASKTIEGPWIHRDGAGGGKRVSATTLNGVLAELPDRSLFSVREGQDDLDQALEARGYTVYDPSILFSAPIEGLAKNDVPRTTAFVIWRPLQIMRDLWAAGDIGQARLDIMERAECVKTSILGRIDDRAAGTTYVGLHDGVAMVHALEVHPDHRRKGLARHMMVQAAKWGVENGAHTFALVTTEANEASKALYTSLGMSLVGRYHDRVKPTE